MAVVLSGIFIFAGKTGFLKSLHGVTRSSRGVEYYPLAVFLVFLIAGGQIWLYVAAVLVLAVGDAFAALIGTHYGAVRYEVEDEYKSLEGSLVFLVIAFLAIHLPMLLLTDLPRPTSVLAALLVAILVTGFEAISLRGTDNLFVPLAVAVILIKITSKPLHEIVFQNLSLVGICIGIGLLVWRFPSFNVGGTIAVILYAYGNWSLGSWRWALPVFIGLVCYILAWYRWASPHGASGTKVRTVVRALLPPSAILVLANSTDSHALFFAPYLTASAVVLAFSLGNTILQEEGRGLRRAAHVGGVALLAWAATALPLWVVQPGVPVIVPLAIAGLVLAATGLNGVLESRGPAVAVEGWTASRFLLSLGAAAALLLLQATDLIPAWNPS
jgi:phytol kinase